MACSARLFVGSMLGDHQGYLGKFHLLEPAGADPAAGYDGLDRLRAFARGTITGSLNNQVSGTPSASQSWSLDTQDNWSSVTTDGSTEDRTHNAANEITQVESGGDATAILYDKSGNLVQDQQFKYTFDAWNRLVVVRSASDNSLVAAYAYDGQNHRTTKRVAGTTTHYYYDAQWQVVEERRGESTQPSAQYLWSARGRDMPVARWADLNGDGDFADANEVAYYCTDANGNVTSLVSAAGQVIERYAYDPYGGGLMVMKADWTAQDSVGGAPAGTRSTFFNEVLWKGCRYNPETGNYQVRNREYSPALGRFLQRDSIGYAGTMNLYAYATANPLTGSDPFGLCESPGGSAINGVRNPSPKKKLTIIVKPPVRSEYATEKQYQEAVAIYKQIVAIIADATNPETKKNLQREMNEYLKNGDRARAEEVGKKLVAVTLVEWASTTGLTSITVEFHPTLSRAELEGDINAGELLKPGSNGKLTMQIATHPNGKAITLEDASMTFFHEAVHAFLAVRTANKEASTPPALAIFENYVTSFKLKNFDPKKMEIGQGEDYNSFITDVVSARKNNSEESLKMTPRNFNATGGFEFAVQTITKVFAAPYYAARKLP